MPIKKIVRIALLSAILYVAKFILECLPNVELVSFLTILYTLVFGTEAFFVVTVFNLFEFIQWGFGTWFISYLYVWPILVLLTLLFKKLFKEEFLLWAILSGLFGLIFGSMFAVVYIFIDPHYALTYFISGLPWDVWHCIANFIIMILIGRPTYKILCKLSRVDIPNP